VAQIDLVATFAYDLAVSDDDAADRIHAGLGFTFARQGDGPPQRADAARRRPTSAAAVFTKTGLAELRAMIAGRRLTDPKRFSRVRQELGIDPMPEAESPSEKG
jgi:hypothetical protein